MNYDLLVFIVVVNAIATFSLWRTLASKIDKPPGPKKKFAKLLWDSIVGDGFSPRMVEAFLTVLAQEPRFRDIPIAVIGETPPEFADALPNIEHVAADPARLVARIIPLVRVRAFEAQRWRVRPAKRPPHPGFILA